jgi:Ca2+-binding RTX toxin-like protein
MAISTNGTIITRLAGALYNEYLSNASYTELNATPAATVAANMLSSDFAGKTDAQIATTVLTNLGLSSVAGLNNWVAAQLTAAGSTATAKGAKLVSMLNDFAMMTADATYGSYATTFNSNTAAGLTNSQTAKATGGAFATAGKVAADAAAVEAAAAKVISDAAAKVVADKAAAEAVLTTASNAAATAAAAAIDAATAADTAVANAQTALTAANTKAALTDATVLAATTKTLADAVTAATTAKTAADKAVVDATTAYTAALNVANPVAADVVNANATVLINTNKATAAAKALTDAAAAAELAKTASDAATADDAAVVTAQTAYTAALAASKAAAAAAVTAAAASKTAAAKTTATTDDAAADSVVTAAAARGAIVAKAEADAAAAAKAAADAAAAKVVADAAAAAKAAADAAAAKVIADAEAIANAPKAFTLTTSANTFTGAGGADYFDGALSINGSATLATSDNLNGNGGNDTLAAVMVGSTIRPTLASIEQIEITGATGANTLDLGAATGYTSLNSVSSTAAGLVTFNQINAATVTGAVTSSAGATFAFTDAALAGTNTFALTLDGATGTVTLNDQGGSNALETVAVNATGGATVLTALTTGSSSGTGVGATKITVSGSANVNLGSALATQVLTLDASAATGNVTATTGASTAGQTVTGGSGNDSFTLGGTSDDSISGGAGIDTITMANTNLTTTDKINGGDGVDILVLSGAADYAVADTQFTGLTSIERLSGATAAQGNTAGVDVSVTANTLAKASGVVRFSDAATGDSAYNLSLGSAYNGTAVTYDFSDVADTASFLATAVGTTAVVTFQGDADGITAGDSLVGGNAAGDTLIFNAAGSTGTIAAGDIGGIENITVTATNGAVTMTSVDTQITDSSSTALVINAAAASGNSTFTLASIAHAMTYTGSAFVDSVTSGGGNDNITLGGGNDRFTTASANLTSADTINGGDDNDTIAISDAATVVDSDYTRVTNVEQLTLGAFTNSITLDVLANASGLARVNGSTGVDTVAIGAGFTNAIRVDISTGAGDSAIVTGVAALTAVTTETGLTADDVLTGGTTANDVLLLTGDAGTGNFTGVSAIETYRVVGDAGAVGITLVEANIAGGSTLVVDASALASGTNALTLVASADNDGKISVTGGAGTDAITLTVSGADYVSGGDAVDTVTVTSAGFTSADTFDGGNGNDIITLSDVSTVVDADFTNVTSVMTLTHVTPAHNMTATLGALAQAAGITSVIGGTGVDTVTIGSGYTGTVRVTTGAGGSDIVSASGSAATLAIQTSANDIDAGDTWTGGTGSSDVLRISAGTAIASALAGVTGFEQITVSADAAVNLTLADVNIAAGVNMIVSGASLITTNALTFNASNETNGTVSVTGGAGADIITGGGLNDTIVGDAGNDIIDGGAGDDSVNAGSGTDTVTINAAGDVADGGSGTDTLTVTSIGAGTFVIDLSATGDQLTTFNGAANAGLQQGFEIVDLSTVNGRVTGTASASGSTITGGAAADSLTGGAGNDSLTGNAGADVLIAGAGVDTLVGGSGNDAYTITLSTVGVHDDTVTETTNTGSTADSLTVLGASPTTRAVLDLTTAGLGNSLIETLDITALSVAGATVTVGANATTVLGSDFVDSITGGASTDSLLGGAGGDIINAGDGADSIDGGAGDDFLKADSALENDVDVITGGTGNDTIVVADTAADNVIEAASGGSNDTLFVNGVDASAIVVNGAADFTGASGLGIEQIVISTAGTATFIGAQLTGNTINITEQAAGNSSLVVTATASATTDLSSLTFNAGSYVDSTGTIVAGIARTSVTDTVLINATDNTTHTIVGTIHGDSITGGAQIDTITPGNGLDTVIGAAGADVIDLTETAASADSYVITGETAAADGLDSITGFAIANDIIRIVDGGTAILGAATKVFAMGTQTSLKAGTGSVAETAVGSNVFVITSAIGTYTGAGMQAVLADITAGASADVGNGIIIIAAAATGNAGIWYDAAGGANDSVNIGTLVGIVLADLASLTTANFVIG